MSHIQANGAEPIISVGVMSAPAITFTFNGRFRSRETGQIISGEHTASLIGSMVEWGGAQYDSLHFEPVQSSATFTLHNVCIGIGFHWERTEAQRFSGALSVIVDADKLWAVNRLPIEDYLFCVIASEMSATSSLELLKAHAVVSRSWLMAQLRKSKRLSGERYCSVHQTDDELVRWYDREDHTLFDVCADDHCQRYQGLTRATSSVVRKAIDATRGEVLVYDGEICDARFSKCCGGVTERFDTCWEPVEHPYLQSFADYTHSQEGYSTDLSIEENARKWIMETPEAFCNTSDATVLRQVLNSYDQETSDFYRWRVEYSAAELSELLAKRTGIDFGTITDLVPIERGPSGRIIKLRIVGSKRTFVIGKELEVRRSLSESHLYSSAFVVEKADDGARFVLHGAGWGHGVGMCQIGAAVMSERGFGYKSIVLHYFRKALIERRW